MRPRHPAALGALFLFLPFTSLARAGTLEVPGDHATLQEAIDAALPGDEILVAPGSYFEHLDLLGKDLLLRSSGGREVTFVDGTGGNGSLLRVASGETLGAVVEGFTFQHGRGGLHSSCQPGSARLGGAIYVGPGSGLTVRDCTFQDNGRQGPAPRGGAIYVANASLEIDGCRFLGNGKDGVTWGGAIGGCGDETGHTLTIRRSEFLGNRGAWGGAMHLIGRAELEVDECHFEDNSAVHGGGLHYRPSGAHGESVLIRRCTFVENTGGFGGGVNVKMDSTVAGEQGTVSIEECVFLGNRAGFGGGLLAIASASITKGFPQPELRVDRCRFEGNLAGGGFGAGLYASECFLDGPLHGGFLGGGADLRATYGGILEVTNCLVLGNESDRGGGLHLSTCGGGEIRVANSTLVGNGSSGIHVREGLAASFQRPAEVVIANSILTENGLTDDDQIHTEIDAHGHISFGTRYSLVQGGYPGPGNVDGLPLFQDPEVGIFCPVAGSPAIDAGDNGALPAGIATDLCGKARFVDDPGTADTGIGPGPVVDMGAYEFQDGGCFLGDVYCGPAVPNSLGLSGQLRATGTGAVGAPLRLQGSDLPPGRIGMFLLASATGLWFPPGSSGRLCLGPPIGRFNRPGEVDLTDASGQLELLVDPDHLPFPVGHALAGETLHFQLWHRDGLASSNFTAGLSVPFH